MIYYKSSLPSQLIAHDDADNYDDDNDENNDDNYGTEINGFNLGGIGFGSSHVEHTSLASSSIVFLSHCHLFLGIADCLLVPIFSWFFLPRSNTLTFFE